MENIVIKYTCFLKEHLVNISIVILIPVHGEVAIYALILVQFEIYQN